MMNRATADPPLVDLAGTLVLLLATTIGALYMAGRIFRIGILRTGQPPKDRGNAPLGSKALIQIL